MNKGIIFNKKANMYQVHIKYNQKNKPDKKAFFSTLEEARDYLEELKKEGD